MILLHPVIASRSCDSCKIYMYDDKPPDRFSLDIVEERPQGSGKLLKRLPKQKPPCWMCPKIPPKIKPIPENAIEISTKNRQAYDHYLMCKATGKFPDDPIVFRNAGYIRQIEDQVQQNIQSSQFGLIATNIRAALGG